MAAMSHWFRLLLPGFLLWPLQRLFPELLGLFPGVLGLFPGLMWLLRGLLLGLLMVLL